MQRDDFKNLATQSKDRLDAAIQTDVFERSDEACQTDTPERKDFQIQACVQQQSESVSTQTEISPKFDFQVQANIPPANDSKAVQTIKEEIAMPNIPGSTAQIPAKKRKLSSCIRYKSDFQVQANIPPANVSKAVQTIEEEIAIPSIPTKKPAGQPLSNQKANQSQAMHGQRNNRPAQAKDVKERFIFIHHNMIILPEMTIFDRL